MQNENAENSMTQLVQLMGDIAEKGCADEIDSEPTSDFAKECWDRLREIYKEPEFRHSYSIISRCMEEYDPAQLDSLRVNLDRVVSFAELQSDTEEVRRVTKSARKLLDHVELECIRLNRMARVQRAADQAESLHNEAIALNNATKEAEKVLEERVKGFHEQSITILGIFSAVVVGFMSGLSMFTSGFNQLNAVSVYVVTFYSIFVGIIVFDILFMLIFFIAKISGHSIARNVPPSRNWFFSTFHRYPCVYCFHFFAIIALVVLIALHLVNGTPPQTKEAAEAVASSIIS
jgi:hypothetical protein